MCIDIMESWFGIANGLLPNKSSVSLPNIFFCVSYNIQHIVYTDMLSCIFQVNEECSTLRLSLSDAQHECEVAKGEVSALQVKVQNLETVVKVIYFWIWQ